LQKELKSESRDKKMKAKIKPIKSFDDLPLIMDCEYVAMLLGTSLNSIYKLCLNGEIKAFKVGKLWRIKREDFESFVKGE